MLTVSNYHYVRENFEAKYPSIFGVTPPEFKNQLQLLKNVGEIISPSELLENTNDILQSKNNFILITFDDGLKEQYDYALPILDEMNLSAVFFANSKNQQEKKVSTVHKIHLLRSIISPENLLNELSFFEIDALSELDVYRAYEIYRFDSKESAELKFLLNFKLSFEQQEFIIKQIFDRYFKEEQVLLELYMSEANLVDLADKKCLGNHTHSHYPVGLLNSSQIQFEIENAKHYFEKLTNSTIEMIAYPYGSEEVCTLEVAAIAKKAGHKMGFTTRKGVNYPNGTPLLLNRFDCNDLIGGKNFK